MSLIFAVQAIDLRCQQQHGHADGRRLLSGELLALYESIYHCLQKDLGDSPLVFDDSDQAIQDYLKTLFTDVASDGLITRSIENLLVQQAEFSPDKYC